MRSQQTKNLGFCELTSPVRFFLECRIVAAPTRMKRREMRGKTRKAEECLARTTRRAQRDAPERRSLLVLGLRRRLAQAHDDAAPHDEREIDQQGHGSSFPAIQRADRTLGSLTVPCRDGAYSAAFNRCGGPARN